MQAPSFATKAGNNILYVIPNKIRLANVDNAITMKFRVNKPLKNQNILFTFNGKVIKKMVKIAISPSEMQKISLAKTLFDSEEGELLISTEDRA